MFITKKKNIAMMITHMNNQIHLIMIIMEAATMAMHLKEGAPLLRCLEHREEQCHMIMYITNINTAMIIMIQTMFIFKWLTKY
jgi:hypothetical protein